MSILTFAIVNAVLATVLVAGLAAVMGLPHITGRTRLPAAQPPVQLEPMPLAA